MIDSSIGDLAKPSGDYAAKKAAIEQGPEGIEVWREQCIASINCDAEPTTGYGGGTTIGHTFKVDEVKGSTVTVYVAGGGAGVSPPPLKTNWLTEQEMEARAAAIIAASESLDKTGMAKRLDELREQTSPYRAAVDNFWSSPLGRDTLLGAITFKPVADCPITYWDALDGQSEEEEYEADLIRVEERDRIASALSQFRESDPSSRRDWELRRRAREELLDRLCSWLQTGAQTYKPKD